MSKYEQLTKKTKDFLQSLCSIATNTKNLHITVIKSFFTFVSTHNKDGVDFRSRFLDLKAKAKKSEPEYLNLNYAIEIYSYKKIL